MPLRVRRIGYLVSAPAPAGVVHSVFARACNIATDELLLTITTNDGADGPATLVLDADCAADLRAYFRVGDRVVLRNDCLIFPSTSLDLAQAAAWRPDPLQAIADIAQVEANVRVAAAGLAARTDRRTSVIHGEARPICKRVERACRVCDSEQALAEALGLVGLGEGLTPAGDDFLVGLLAGLDPLAGDRTARATFLVHLGAGLASHAHRTTDVAAHYLRLAAGGHFGADIHRLRGAVLSASDLARVAQLADDALAAGATSGADMIAGLLAGFSAWLPCDSPFERPDDD